MMSGTNIRTMGEAEKALLQLLPANLSGAREADPVVELRRAAMARFERAGLPTRRIESWHYSDLRAVMREAYPIASFPDAGALELAKKEIARLPGNGARIVLVDGFYQAALSSAEPCVSLLDLDEALAGADAALLADIAPVNGQDMDGALALNAALMSGGVIVGIAPSSAPVGPVEIVSITTGRKDASLFSRSLVHAGTASRATIVERHISLGEAASQKNDALVIKVAEGAHTEHVYFGEGNEAGTLHVNTLMADVARDAKLSSFALLDKGAFVRRQMFVRFGGPHAAVDLSGLALVRGKDHRDTTLVVDHTHPDCVSKEYFKQIVDGAGTGVFQGKVCVAPQAQKTDGAMKSRTILLSDDAAMYNKPELEIFADDVACSHGATCGSLDPNQLFYAMARGLSRGEAEALLLEAFGSDAIDRVSHERLRDELKARLREWLDTRNA